ncbi:MAG TPA: hypothetical protein VMK66_08285 [Myxococcales bacterium]|nr:hypothetical protein [Myxococcales bacterium]
MKATALIVLCAGLPAAAAGDRQLLDEVVAVVEAHSITLSEVTAETRVRLAESQGPSAANAPLDRKILAASLRKTIEERIVLSEIQRLKLFDLEPGEVETLLARLRARFPTRADYDAFTRSLELTDEEIGAILARQMRVARYLDNRLKLAAQLRDSELAEATKGRSLTDAQRDQLREQLAEEKYLKMLKELLADLRRRASVRVLDPLDGGAPVAEQ